MILIQANAGISSIPMATAPVTILCLARGPYLPRTVAALSREDSPSAVAIGAGRSRA
jgi:hypothetical protein